MVSPEAELPSQRSETWNDTEAINRHREMTPSQRIALAIEASRAALLFAEPNSLATFAPDRTATALNVRDVDFVIVGDLAGAAHGVVRATRALELVPEPSVENLSRLAAALVELGAEHSIDHTLTGTTLARPVSLKLRTRHGDVQVLTRMPAVPSYAEVRENAIVVDLAPDAHSVVCSLTDLRAMKLASGRPRDLVDVAELDELHNGS